MHSSKYYCSTMPARYAGVRPSYIRFGHVSSMYRSSPLRSTLNRSYIRFGHVSSMYRSSPWRSTLNTSYIRFGHVSSMYRSSPLRSTLNTNYIRFGHVSSMYRSSPWRSTVNRNVSEKDQIIKKLRGRSGTRQQKQDKMPNTSFPFIPQT